MALYKTPHDNNQSCSQMTPINISLKYSYTNIVGQYRLNGIPLLTYFEKERVERDNAGAEDVHQRERDRQERRETPQKLGEPRGALSCDILDHSLHPPVLLHQVRGAGSEAGAGARGNEEEGLISVRAGAETVRSRVPPTSITLPVLRHYDVPKVM